MGFMAIHKNSTRPLLPSRQHRQPLDRVESCELQPPLESSAGACVVAVFAFCFSGGSARRVVNDNVKLQKKTGETSEPSVHTLTGVRMELETDGTSVSALSNLMFSSSWSEKTASLCI